MATTKVTTGGITDATIATADIADDAVTDAKLANSINTAIAANTAKASITINTNADNRLITGSGTANTLNGEANITAFTDSDGAKVLIGASADATNTAGEASWQGLKLKGSRPYLVFHEDDRSGEAQHGFVAHTTGCLSIAKMAGRLNFSVSESGAVAEKMTLLANGKLGVGTNTPQELLHVWPDAANTSSAYVRVTSGDRGSGTGIQMGSDSDGDGRLNVVSNANLKFYTNNSERLRLTNTGQLLQGETSAFGTDVGGQFRYDNAGGSARYIFRNRGNNDSSRVRLIMSTLNRAANADIFSGFEQYQSGGMAIFNGQTDNSHCGIDIFTGNWRPLRLKNGNVSGTDVVHISAYWGTSNGLQMEVGGTQSGTHKAIRFQTSHYGGERGYIGVTLGGTSYNSSSDYRMKQDIVSLTDATSRLKNLLPKRFKWKEDPTYTVDGFLAHEAQTVVPESVTGEKDAVDSDGKPIYQVIDQSKLIPLLTAALQEAVAKIETLETKVAALEAA